MTPENESGRPAKAASEAKRETSAEVSDRTIGGEAQAPARRDSFASVGAAIRQAEARMTELRPSAPSYRLMFSIVAAVQSWSRLTDAIPVYANADTNGASLAERANVRNDDARVALKWLAENGVIVYRPTRGRGRVSTIGLPPEGESGFYAPAEKPRPSRGFSEPYDGAKTPAARGENPRPSWEKAPSLAGPSEKTPEKAPEDVSPREPKEDTQSLTGDAVAADGRSGSTPDNPTKEEDRMPFYSTPAAADESLLAKLRQIPAGDLRDRVDRDWRTGDGARETLRSCVDRAIRGDDLNLDLLARLLDETPIAFVVTWGWFLVDDGSQAFATYAEAAAEIARRRRDGFENVALAVATGVEAAFALEGEAAWPRAIGLKRKRDVGGEA